MKPRGSLDSTYKGSEYMSLYPHISYYSGTEQYKDGTPIARGYYVRTLKDNGFGYYITPLKKWFQI